MFPERFLKGQDEGYQSSTTNPIKCANLPHHTIRTQTQPVTGNSTEMSRNLYPHRCTVGKRTWDNMLQLWHWDPWGNHGYYANITAPGRHHFLSRAITIRALEPDMSLSHECPYQWLIFRMDRGKMQTVFKEKHLAYLNKVIKEK